MVTTITEKKPVVAPTMIYAAALSREGAALAGALHGDGPPRLTVFTTYPPTLTEIGQELRHLPLESTIIIDGGLHGLDLWHFLGYRRSTRHWQLFEVARPELRRAEVAGRLRAAFEQGAFTIQRGIAGEDALRRAITQATREDAAERVEIAVLSLCVVDRRRPRPRIG